MPNQQTIVLIPALLCDSRLYEPVLNALSDDFDVRVMDTSRHDNLEEQAADMLASLPPRFALAGNSMGGYVALAMMAQAAERVTHLALMGTNAHADSHEAREKRLQAVRLAEVGKFSRFVDGYVEGALRPETAHEYGPVMRAMARDLGPDVLIRQQLAIMNRQDMRDNLPAWDIPALVMYGANDELAPLSAHEMMADSLPNATFEIIQDCGHLIPLEQPDAVAFSLRRLLGR